VLPEGAAPEAALTLQRNWIDANYLATLGVELAAGRGFAEDESGDSLEAVLLNEAAVQALGWASPGEAVGQTLELNPGSGEGRGTVIGVVRDFNFHSMHEHIAPLLLTPHASPTNVLVRIQPAGIDATLGALRADWQSFTDQPFTYRFLDDTLDAQYRADARWGWVIAVASLLAIFIACLGLFGLAAFMAEQRTKEIGIRKVMGASVPGIVLLMARTFLQLVAAAFVLATPVAYLLMQRWLEAFAYRIEPGGGTFFLAGGAVLFIALASVISQALRAALADPVKSLRYE
jgi:putative ABC transport system permease protein